MLTKEDAEWIKQNRREITRNRTKAIDVIGETVIGNHPLTGEEIVEEVVESTEALVTEIVSAFKADMSMIQGFIVEEGDLWVDLGIDDFSIELSKLKRIKYYGDYYTIMAKDRAGIGITNRVIIVARREK